MARLYRPTIPVEVKCRVILRQLGEMFIDKVIDENRARRDAGYMVGVVGLRGRSLGKLLSEKLSALAELLNCDVKELRLDHDPPLGARPLMHKRKTGTIVYNPDANDPEHLFYRPHGAQHAKSHDTKTRIRGDHGQYSDIALIKRERRRQRREKPTAYAKKVERFKDWKRKRDKALRTKLKKEKKRCRSSLRKSWKS